MKANMSQKNGASEAENQHQDIESATSSEERQAEERHFKETVMDEQQRWKEEVEKAEEKLKEVQFCFFVFIKSKLSSHSCLVLSD